jgi:hypothetical protein
MEDKEKKKQTKDTTKEVYDSLYKEKVRKENIRKYSIISGIVIVSLVVISLIYFLIIEPYLDRLSKEPKSFDIVVSLAYGDVKVSNVILGSSKGVEIGYHLKEGDVIITSNDSECELKVSHFSEIKILENSVVSFSELITKTKETIREINLQSGTVLSLFKGKKPNERLNIKTDSGFASVRGTYFYVSSDNKKSKLVVAEGKVSMSPRLKNLEEVMNLSKDEGLKSKILTMQVDSGIFVEGGKKSEVTPDTSKKAQELIQKDVENIKNLVAQGKSISDDALANLSKKVSEIKDKLNLKAYDASPEELGLFKEDSKVEVKNISITIQIGSIKDYKSVIPSSDYLLTFSRNGVVYVSKAGVIEFPLNNVYSAIAYKDDITVLNSDKDNTLSIKFFSTSSTNLKKEINISEVSKGIKVIGNIVRVDDNVVVPTTKGLLIVNTVNSNMLMVNVGKINSGITLFGNSLILANEDGEVYKVKLDKIGNIYSLSPKEVIIKLADVGVKEKVSIIADKDGSIYIVNKTKVHKISDNREIFVSNIPETYYEPILLDKELLITSGDKVVGIDKESGKEVYNIQFDSNIVGYPYVKGDYLAVNTTKRTYIYDLKTRKELSRYDIVGSASYIEGDKVYIVSGNKIFVASIK